MQGKTLTSGKQEAISSRATRVDTRPTLIPRTADSEAVAHRIIGNFVLWVPWPVAGLADACMTSIFDTPNRTTDGLTNFNL